MSPECGSTITIRTDRGRRVFSVARNETGGYLLRGARPGPAGTVTHGICPPCREQVRREREEKARHEPA